MQSGLRLQLGEQIIRLGSNLEDSGDLAALHLLNCKGMIDVDRLDIDAQALEDHWPRDARTRSLDMESYLLTGEILQAADVRARQDVEFSIVHLRYVVDPLLNILRLAGFFV